MAPVCPKLLYKEANDQPDCDTSSGAHSQVDGGTTVPTSDFMVLDDAKSQGVPKRDSAVFGLSFRLTPAEQDLEKLKLHASDIQSYFKDQGYQFVFQLEQGADTKKYHYQGAIHLTRKKLRPVTLVNDFRRHFPEHQSASIYCAHAHNIRSTTIYSQKLDTAVAGPWYDRIMRRPPPLIDKPFPWQQKVIDSCKTEPDDRIVNWVFDPVGGSGKSKLAIYLYVKFGAVPMSYGKTSDILHVYSQNRNALAYIFDLTRCKPHDLGNGDLYSTIESIKTGLVVTTKYNGGVVYSSPPHIWVFSNNLPDISSLSRDRWKIWTIANKDLVPYQSAMPKAILQKDGSFAFDFSEVEKEEKFFQNSKKKFGKKKF